MAESLCDEFARLYIQREGADPGKLMQQNEAVDKVGSRMIVRMDELQRKVLTVDPAAEETADEEVTMSEEEKSDDDSDEDKPPTMGAEPKADAEDSDEDEDVDERKSVD